MVMRDSRRASLSGNAERRRWQRLPESARRLLTAFVVHPESLKASWLPRLALEDEDVDTLSRAAWIKEDESNNWVLKDLKGREGVRKLIPWSWQQQGHRMLAELCRQERALAALAARHLESAGDPSAASAWMDAVVEHATMKELAGFQECLDAAQRLAREHKDPAIMDELVRVIERCMGNPDVAGCLSGRLENWLKDARRRRQQAVIARFAPLFASLLAARGEHIAGAEWRVEAATALQSLGEARRAARQLAAAAETYTYALQFSAARETALAAVELARRCDDAALHVEALSHAGLLLGMKGRTVAGREYLEQALDLALKHRLTSAAAETYRMLGTVAEYASCYGDEQTAFAKALAYCRRHDETATAELCLGCLSYSLFRSGNWARSRAIVGEVLGRKSAPAVSRLVAGGVLGLLLAHRGELREAGPLLEAAIEGARRTGIFAMEFFGLWGLAMVEEQAGQPAATALHYRSLLEFWRRTEDRHDAIPGLSCGGLFFADRGELEAAGEFGAALDQIARDTANPEALGASALVAGEIQRRAGNLRGAARTFERALAAFEKRDLVIERVRVLARIARVQRALGNVDKADEAAKEAGKRARRLGARALLDALESDTPSTASAPDSWGGLSPRQRDVARHLAGGLTNKEIAARIGVSVRTVDMHVAHVLRRLGCRTRSEAAGRIAVLLE